MVIKSVAENIALIERRRLGLGDFPIINLRDILEQYVGLYIFYLKMPAKYSQLNSYNEEIGFYIAINSNHPEEKRRWSMAHGYFHYLVHCQKVECQQFPENEQLAKTFCGHFLMPTSGLLKQFNDMCRAHGEVKFTPTDLLKLAHFYGVPVAALAIRLEDIDVLPSGTWNKLKERGLKIRQSQKKLGLEEIPQRTDVMPLRFQHIAIDSVAQDLTTEGRVADFLAKTARSLSLTPKDE